MLVKKGRKMISRAKQSLLIGTIPEHAGTTIRDKNDDPLSFMEARSALRDLLNEIEDPIYAPNHSRTVIPELEWS